jgi:hypothetical protein
MQQRGVPMQSLCCNELGYHHCFLQLNVNFGSVMMPSSNNFNPYSKKAICAHSLA